MVMAYDQVFFATRETKPTPVSGPRMLDIPRIFIEDVSVSENIYYLRGEPVPASIVIDLSETIPVNTLELSK